MTVRIVLAVLLAIASVGAAAEFPDSVSVNKCRGKKKIFAVLRDPTGIRKIKMKHTFYIQAGSAYVQGCKTARGSDACQDTFGVSLFLAEGETPCFAQSGLPFIDYARSVGDSYENWTSTGDCTLTVAKYDAVRGRVKGTYRTQVIDASQPTPVYGDLVGCFSARLQN